ncbi:MAG: ubiquinone/menaquinone biosynthesis methyltransferase [Acidimicrobiales bacterium]
MTEPDPVLAGVEIDLDELPSGDRKRTAVRAMFDTIAPRYDLVNRIVTFRLDVRWRRRTIRELGLPGGSVVLDLACGTGDLCRELTSRGHVALGLDLSMGMLRAARTSSPLVHADILAMPLVDRACDGATCGFALRNLAELPGFFEELARVVRPGGRIALLEVAEPPNRLLRRGHKLYFGRVVPRIGALLSDRTAYRYLPRSVAYLPSAPELGARLRDAGFTDVRHQLLTAGLSQLFTATRCSPHRQTHP